MSIGIEVEYPVAHVDTQNRLVKSLLKRLKLVASYYSNGYLEICNFVCCIIDSHQANKLSKILYYVVGFWSVP